MSQHRTPAQGPDSPTAWGNKILLLGLQCFVLMIGALIIWTMSYTRDERSRYVAKQISKEWGADVRIDGPYIAQHPDSGAIAGPAILDCAVEVETKSLHRNIYEAEVFNAAVTLSGTFSKDSIAMLGDTVYVRLDVAAKQITSLQALSIGGKQARWTKTESGLEAMVDVSSMPAVIDFAASFSMHGSSSIFIKQAGEQTSVTIDGEARNPSFSGSSLPEDRLVSGRSFSASWIADDYPAIEAGDGGFVGATFLVGVDRYQKVSRSLKYSFIIILLTYVSVIFTEIMMKQRIPLLNYFLIGVALILFYSLLLAFAEHMAFATSYLIAALMIVALIAGYMWKMLDSRKVGVMIACMLTAFYTCIFILLSVSTWALLMGSLILFCVLAAMMYGSLQIARR